MSRIRSTHPGVWTDERFVSVSSFARLFFMGIWNECDDFGSFEWSPLKLKMRLLPADNVDAAELLAELEAAGCIMRYDLDGRAFGAVRNFCKYQRPKKPHATFPQTEAVVAFVGTEDRSTRDGSEPVGNRFGTGGENRRQMEDGGGNREKESKKVTPPKGGQPLAFEGKVIRLNLSDFRSWKRNFPLLDLPAVLQARDDWLDREADQKTRSKWFMATSNHLANLQARAAALERERASAGEMPC